VGIPLLIERDTQKTATDVDVCVGSRTLQVFAAARCEMANTVFGRSGEERMQEGIDTSTHECSLMGQSFPHQAA
jgi:hypothetical protein